LQEDGLLHTTCGTPNYVAPEVIDDKGYHGASADIWSCGVILFVLMAGYLPFDEPNLMTLYKKIHRANFTCPAWVSPSARKLILKILDPNPKTRITAAQIYKNEWFQKNYKPSKLSEKKDVNLDDIDAVFNESTEYMVTEQKETKPVILNAFELISHSHGLNLSGLFETPQDLVKRETRFTSKRPAKEIISTIEEAAKPLGFNVQKRDYKMKLQGDKHGRKGHLSVATEVSTCLYHSCVLFISVCF
jgi:serine/threonine protein kinase